MPSEVSSSRWDERFLGLCLHIAQWSKDPHVKVGSVVVDSKRRVIGTGYNGFPRGAYDDPALYERRDTKLELVVHAEVNAILTAPNSVEGATLYCVPRFPCNECAKTIIQAGISTVVARQTKWKPMHTTALKMFAECGVHVLIFKEDGTLDPLPYEAIAL